MKVYVVFGDTGEYSDHTQWMVCAYLSEEKAKARVIELGQLIMALGCPSDAEWEVQEKAHKAIRDAEGGDPNFSTSYTGTGYYYEETELKDYAP